MAIDPLRCALVGLGAAGSGLAVEIARRGLTLAGWWDPDAAIARALEAAGGLAFEGVLGSGAVALPPPAASAAAAIEAADVVFVSSTADRHAAVAQSLRPALQPSQIVVLHCGYVGGSKIFHDATATRQGYAEGSVFELSNTLHLCGRIDPATLTIRGAKRWLEIAGPAAATARPAFAAMMGAFPEFSYSPKVLESGLNNPNCIGHVPASVGNAVFLGRELVAASTGVLQFEEARAGRVAALSAALEEERDAVILALGLTPLPSREFGRRAYPAGSRLTGGVARFGPMLQPRYLSEDIPCALVPLESLGALVGVPTPVVTALITLGEVVAGQGFRAAGRTVQAIGEDWIAGQRGARRPRP